MSHKGMASIKFVNVWLVLVCYELQWLQLGL